MGRHHLTNDDDIEDTVPETEQRTTARDTLVLDIGGDIGALTIHTGPDRDETEIEISPVGADPAAHRTHNVVHVRQVGARTFHAAVFPSVPAGEYTVWRDADTAAGAVTIHGGQVTEYRLT
jgi:hypothetical protein